MQIIITNIRQLKSKTNQASVTKFGKNNEYDGGVRIHKFMFN